METTEQMKTMELEGNLRAFKFPEILQFLAMGGMTGVLRLSQDAREVELGFRQGKIIAGATQKRSVRLGQMLVYAGRLTRQALEEALEAQAASVEGTLLGEVLVEKRLAEPETIKETLRLQLQEEIWELFSWDDGQFRFEQEAMRGPSSIEITLDVEPILLEGSRRMDEWQEIKDNIGNVFDVYRINPDFSGAPDSPLDADTWRVLSLINGILSVEAVSRLSNLGKFETYWALNNLLQAEVIANVKATGPARPSAAATPAAPSPDQMGRLTAEDGVYDNPFESSPKIKPASEGPVESRQAKESKPSKRGLFGRKKVPVDSQPDAALFYVSPITGGPAGDPDAEFGSDVGLVCAAVNRLLESVRGEKNLTALAPMILDKSWRETSERFPRSDAIDFVGQRFRPALYERYLALEGSISAGMAGTREDCLAALRLYWERVMAQVNEHVDPRTATQLGESIISAYGKAEARIQISEFSLRRWLQDSA